MLVDIERRSDVRSTLRVHEYTARFRTSSMVNLDSSSRVSDPPPRRPSTLLRPQCDVRVTGTSRRMWRDRSTVYFQDLIYLGGCESAHGGQANFSFSTVQCTILQQNGKYSNFPALLLGTILYLNNYYNRWRLDRSILYIREKFIYYTRTGPILYILQLLIC